MGVTWLLLDSAASAVTAAEASAWPLVRSCGMAGFDVNGLRGITRNQRRHEKRFSEAATRACHP